jgi:hypothetical protein
MLDEQARSLYVSNAYTAMQRSIQLGILYDESQHVDVLSSDEAAKYGIHITKYEASRCDVTSKSCFREQVRVGETFSADGNEEILTNIISKKQVNLYS